MLGEFDVTMNDGIARMDNGALAGSTLKLIEGVKNLQSWSDASLSEIWHLASLSPARSLGLMTGWAVSPMAKKQILS